MKDTTTQAIAISRNLYLLINAAAVLAAVWCVAHGPGLHYVAGMTAAVFALVLVRLWAHSPSVPLPFNVATGTLKNRVRTAFTIPIWNSSVRAFLRGIAIASVVATMATGSVVWFSVLLTLATWVGTAYLVDRLY